MTSISPAGIIRTDLEGKLTYANRRFGEIIGHKGEVEELFGQKLCNFVHTDDREVIRERSQDDFRREISKFEVRWGLQDKFRWAIGELVPEKIGDEVRPSSEIY